MKFNYKSIDNNYIIKCMNMYYNVKEVKIIINLKKRLIFKPTAIGNMDEDQNQIIKC